MSVTVNSIKSAVVISFLSISLVGCQNISNTAISTYAPKNKESVQSVLRAKWAARFTSIKERQQKIIVEARERRLERAEKRKESAAKRKVAQEERREARIALRESYKKVQSSSNQSKINRAFGQAKTEDKNTSLRVGWVKIDGKFVYRSAKTIKAEQEAAKKAAAKKAKNKKRRASVPKGRYNKLIAKYAAQHGVPYRLARAVVQVESSFRPNVTGSVGEIGLMQIRLATARGMGYKGSAKQLYNPATNLYWGMKYLGKAHRLAGGSTCGTILKYNAGHGAKRMNPISQRYCNRVSRII